jgi:hypothetical protein
VANVKDSSIPPTDGGLSDIPANKLVGGNDVETKSVEELVSRTTRLKSQAEIDAEITLVRLETEKLKLEKEKLELEKLKNDVLNIRRDQEQARVSRETVQESLDFAKEKRINDETFCTHMKGGDSQTMMNGGAAQGNDTSNFAMWQHTLTSGVTFRMCSRCGKTWFPKDPDYKWAMSRPTRNSPSTGCPSPGLIRFPKRVRVVSEVPHRERPVPEFNTEYAAAQPE